MRYGLIERLGLGAEGALAACFVQAQEEALAFKLAIRGPLWGGRGVCSAGCQWSSRQSWTLRVLAGQS